MQKHAHYQVGNDLGDGTRVGGENDTVVAENLDPVRGSPQRQSHTRYDIHNVLFESETSPFVG